MFGGIGLFCDDAMFALVSNDCCYLRGGNELDEELMQLNCENISTSRDKRRQPLIIMMWQSCLNPAFPV